jgi:hypothetical protein
MSRDGRWGNGRGERGVILPLMALLLVVLLSFVALTLDIGRLTVARRQIQNGVDAGALAGVQVLPDDVADAKNAAYDWAQKNGMALSEVSSVTISKTNVANDTITVIGTRKVNYVFAPVMNKISGDTTVSAAAIVGSVVGGTGIMPFGLLDLNGPSPGFGYTFGQQVTIKEVPGNFFGPGNYGFLALDGKGGANLRDVIARGGSQTRYKVGDSVDTEPGQKTGPTKQGLDAWSASHNDSMSSSCNDWNGSHSYVNGKLAITPQCQYRVILIPIIDHWPNGRKSVTILGFAQMYLAGYDEDNGKAINAIFLDDSWSYPDVTFGPLNDWGTRVVKVLK